MGLETQEKLVQHKQEIAEMFAARVSIENIARQVGVAKETLRKFMDENNMRPNERRWRNRYRMNHAALDGVKQGEKLSWTQFLSERAYLNRDGVTVIVEIDDLDRLERLKAFLETDRPIEAVRNRHRLRLRSRQLWSSIQDWRTAQERMSAVST